MSGRKGMSHYGVEVKQVTIRLVLEEHLAYAELADRIEAWVRMYQREAGLSFHKPIGQSMKTESEERNLKRLRMENALLKKIPYQIAESAACTAQYRMTYHHKKEYETTRSPATDR
jgi:transposase-like protein